MGLYWSWKPTEDKKKQSRRIYLNKFSTVSYSFVGGHWYLYWRLSILIGSVTDVSKYNVLQQYYYRPQTKFTKVMFLHLSVCHSVHRGGLQAHIQDGGGSPGPHLGWGVSRPTPGMGVGHQAHTWGGLPHCMLGYTPPYGYCCGQYASYWNAFLLGLIFSFRWSELYGQLTQFVLPGGDCDVWSIKRHDSFNEKSV